jgi:hypothetical protein
MSNRKKITTAMMPRSKTTRFIILIIEILYLKKVLFEKLFEAFAINKKKFLI